MDRLKRDAILIRLIESLHHKGSWCGETHVQKATYFLQEMVRAETGFDFILYKHGPFSFDLRDELAAMQADGLVSLKMQHPDYGPSIVTDSAAETLCKRYPKTLGKHAALIQFVADKLGDKRVTELERLATALLVRRELGIQAKPEECAARIHELKGHISVEEALKAVQMVQGWSKEANKLPRKSA